MSHDTSRAASGSYRGGGSRRFKLIRTAVKSLFPTVIRNRYLISDHTRRTGRGRGSPVLWHFPPCTNNTIHSQRLVTNPLLQHTFIRKHQITIGDTAVAIHTLKQGSTVPQASDTDLAKMARLFASP